MQTIQTSIANLKAGDIVHAHGGTFKVLEDARASSSHFPRDAVQVHGFGPTVCAVAPAVCLSGVVPGYFRPGSDWTFQGHRVLVNVHVERQG
jgi:hypothetical protein